MRKVYFDNAATTPVDEQVIQAMLPYWREHFGNPSSTHSFGRSARAGIEEVRKKVASYLSCHPLEIIFTSAGTESNNLALKSAVRDLGIKFLISSPIEHHCVLYAAREAAEANGIPLQLLEVDSKGHMSMASLRNFLESNKGKGRSMVSLMHANNEIGTMIDLDEVSRICAEYDAIFHTDTVQTIGHFPIDLSKTAIHFLSGSAHKFHGPKGIGFLFIRKGLNIKPQTHGGSQEKKLRAGTENVAGIIGLGKALELACDNLDEYSRKTKDVRDYMMKRLQEEIPDLAFHGDPEGRSLYTVLNVSLPPNEANEMILFSLDLAGIAASGGSACSAGATTGSHVLAAIGSDPERKGVRFSFSHQNTREEVDYTVTKLKEILKIEVTA